MDKNNDSFEIDSRIIEILSSEYGITISTDVEEDPSATKIPVSDEALSHLSLFTASIPTLGANAIAGKALDRTAYAITFQGKDVLPQELWQKKNGNYISNLKGTDKYWGKQTDIQAINNVPAQGALLASSVFAAASVATSTYYLKSIDDKLENLQQTTKAILGFLENDKQSQVEADLEILKDIAENLEAIKENRELKSVRINQFSALQREAARNVKFYQKEIQASLEMYASKKRTNKKELPPLEKLKKNYFYYRTCLLEYALSKLIELQLTDGQTSTLLSRTAKEVNSLSEEHKALVSHLLTDIYGHHLGSAGSKALDKIAGSLGFMSTAVEKTPLKKTGLDETLQSLSAKTGDITKKRAKKDADQVVTRADYGIVDPFVKDMKTAEELSQRQLTLIHNGEETYIQVEPA